MFKKILILLLLPLSRSFGQELPEEKTTLTEQSKYAEEIAGISAGLTNTLHTGTAISTDHMENTKQYAVENFDYFSPEFYLKKGAPQSNGMLHETKIDNYIHVTATLNEVTFNNLRCFKIADKYDAVFKPTGLTYHYDNVIFYYEDESGEPVGSVTYIKKQTGVLVNETKIIKIYGEQNNEITISPNPAHQFVDLRLNIKVDDDYEVSILDINQKTVAVPVKKYMSAGITKCSVPVNLTPGHYLVMLKGNKSKPTTQKLIIE